MTTLPPRNPLPSLPSKRIADEANDVALWRCRIDDALRILTVAVGPIPPHIADAVCTLRAIERRMLAAESDLATDYATAVWDEAQVDEGRS